MTRAAWRSWLLIAILLLACGLRLYRLGAGSLWYDETVSVHLAAKSVPALLQHTAGDIHPPGYYLLLHGWLRLAGRSDFAAAFPSLFFGVLLVALAGWLGRRVFGVQAGLLAAFLVAISPYHLWYSQEVRMYTLAAVLAMGVLAATLRLLAAPAGTALPWRPLAVYAVCAALGLWVLYYFAFLLVAVNLMVLAWWLVARVRAGRERRRTGVSLAVPWPRGLPAGWLATQVAALVLYAPWLSIAWRQAADPPVPPWRSFTGLGDVLLQTWTALSAGQSARPALAWPILILTAALVGLGLWDARRRPQRATADWLLAGAVFLPIVLIYLASFITPLFHVRYALPYSTPFYVLLGAGLVVLGRRWRPGLWLSLAAIAAFAGVSIGTYHFDPHYAADDHRAAASFLAGQWRPGDAILVNAGYAYPALLTYWDGEPIAWRGRLTDDGWTTAGRNAPVVVQTGAVDGDPGLGWGDPQSDFYAMPQAETSAALEQLFAVYDRVWVYRIYDTVTDPEGSIRAWLEANAIPFEDQVFTGESQLRVQGFVAGRLSGSCDPGGQVAADGALRLRDTDIAQRTVTVGSALYLAPMWCVESAPPEGSLLFAGLFDAADRRWAQADERPLGSLYPASTWLVGTTVRTPLQVKVPPGTPLGSYRLEIGWYRFVDGQPRWLPWAEGDRLALGDVTVVAPADWSALAQPAVSQPSGVRFGGTRRLLGFDAPTVRVRPGDSLPLDLVWQALVDAPPEATTVLYLADDAGRVLAESAGVPAGPAWVAGQTVREPLVFQVPGGLAPGAYSLALRVRGGSDTWLPVRRGLLPLGTAYPLTTILVEGRPLQLSPPRVEHQLDARFGQIIHLAGYDLQMYPAGCEREDSPCRLQLVLHWQALVPASASLNIFAHLTEPDDPAAILAQADVAPAVSGTAWQAGEYLSQTLAIELPAGLPAGHRVLLIGFYDGSSGTRLPVLDATGQPQGDSLVLQELLVGH